MGKLHARTHHKIKKRWWWNEELQKIKAKREAKKIHDRTGSEEDRRTNKETKKESKKRVAQTEAQAREGRYENLQTREGEKRMCALASKEKRPLKILLT